MALAWGPGIEVKHEKMGECWWSVKRSVKRSKYEALNYHHWWRFYRGVFVSAGEALICADVSLFVIMTLFVS